MNKDMGLLPARFADDGMLGLVVGLVDSHAQPHHRVPLPAALVQSNKFECKTC